MSLRLRIVAFAVGVAVLAVCVTQAAHVAVRYPDLSTLSTADLQQLITTALAAAAAVSIPAALVADWLGRSVMADAGNAIEAAELNAADHVVASAARVGDVASQLGQVESAAQAAVQQQRRAARDLGSTAEQVAGRVAELAASSDRLVTATHAVQGIAREAAVLADGGRGGLDRMARSMEHLDEAMNTFTRKLATISQRATGITAVVTTIAKVAEQTNLLSVNATIEAEKAGESGRGFRIVAQEIRRLADQTAMATKDIERMVRDMQGAVSGGTMEMDRFRNEVSARIGEVAAVSEQLGRIIEPVRGVTRSLDEVHAGIEAQAGASRRIHDAVEGLRLEATQSATAVTSGVAALDDLGRLVGELNAELTRLQSG
jgi:methyl-accepting chemotaxis protein WspA